MVVWWKRGEISRDGLTILAIGVVVLAFYGLAALTGNYMASDRLNAVCADLLDAVENGNDDRRLKKAVSVCKHGGLAP